MFDRPHIGDIFRGVPQPHGWIPPGQDHFLAFRPVPEVRKQRRFLQKSCPHRVEHLVEDHQVELTPLFNQAQQLRVKPRRLAPLLRRHGKGEGHLGKKRE